TSRRRTVQSVGRNAAGGRPVPLDVLRPTGRGTARGEREARAAHPARLMRSSPRTACLRQFLFSSRPFAPRVFLAHHGRARAQARREVGRCAVPLSFSARFAPPFPTLTHRGTVYGAQTSRRAGAGTRPWRRRRLRLGPAALLLSTS